MTPETELWHDDGRAASGIFATDPFWAIHWPGGQSVARFILDHPGLVQGRRVFDLGCGGGAIAIAALMSGARRVLANDIDPMALEATEINAEINGVSQKMIELCSKDYLNVQQLLPQDWDAFDVLLVGDMYFDRELGQAVGQLASTFMSSSSGDRGSKSVFIGDPGRWFLTEHRPPNLCCRAKFELPENVRRENSGMCHGYVFEVMMA